MTGNPRNNSEAGRVQIEAEEGSAGTEGGYLAQAMVVGQKVADFGVETGKWVWLKIREAATRVVRA